MVTGMPVMWEVVFMMERVTVEGEGGIVRGVVVAMVFWRGGGFGGEGGGMGIYVVGWRGERGGLRLV